MADAVTDPVLKAALRAEHSRESVYMDYRDSVVVDDQSWKNFDKVTTAQVALAAADKAITGNCGPW